MGETVVTGNFLSGGKLLILTFNWITKIQNNNNKIQNNNKRTLAAYKLKICEKMNCP